MSEPPTTVDRPQRVSPLLLAEALGFLPQLLLDDIINIANDSVGDGVDGMETFLQKWAEDRRQGIGGSKHEVEQGLVTFQTLLEYHTDIAFDFFEAWSLRNIFAIPPDLPVVLPHHQGLDLTQTPEREQELLDEIESLRKKLDNQRRLHRLQTRALHVSENRRKRAEQRLEHISLLDSQTMDTLTDLPTKLVEMYDAVAGLSALDPATVSALSQFQMTERGKRLWETSKTGYLKWSVGQLLARASGDGEDSSRVEEIRRNAEGIGKAVELKETLERL
ncbi:Mis12-domain-containing protein [Mycena floridula]|nr:Mis12-domain-containing protein [Mycena floridula]